MGSLRLFWIVAIGGAVAACAAGVIQGDENSVVVQGNDQRAAAERHCAQFGKLAVVSAQPQPSGGTLYRCI